VIGSSRWTADDGPPTDTADGKPGTGDDDLTGSKTRRERAEPTRVGQGARSSPRVPGARLKFAEDAEYAQQSREPRFLTVVHTLYRDGKCNFRVLFGTPYRRCVVVAMEGHSRELFYFTPGARFALDLWVRNTYGTIQWRCFVCEAIEPGAAAVAVPFVAPAARVLLHTQGAAQSRLFLAWLAQIEESGIDPLNCPADTFEAAHFRLHGSRADRTPARRLSGHP
jgi:hypothetical protein